MHSSEAFERQCGTALWIIDRLALRVGGEKDEDEADTVGCCSLRCEHISFPAENTVHLKFLGKDSMVYDQAIDLTRYGPVGQRVLHNLRKLTKDKKPDDDIFDALKPDMLNEELSKLMPGLSAKVFRTYNASVTLESELELLSADTPVLDKVSEYNRANREVAILCNHQKTVSAQQIKTLEASMSKINVLKEQLAVLVAAKAKLGKGGAKAGGLLPAMRDPDVILKEATKLGTATATKDAVEKAIKLAGGDAAGAAAAQAAQPKPEDLQKCIDAEHKRLKTAEAHLFKEAPTADALDTKIRKWEESIAKSEAQYRDKDDNKAVALGAWWPHRREHAAPRSTTSN
jgi:DNA topoisomerase-1